MDLEKGRSCDVCWETKIVRTSFMVSLEVSNLSGHQRCETEIRSSGLPMTQFKYKGDCRFQELTVSLKILNGHLCQSRDTDDTF